MATPPDKPASRILEGSVKRLAIRCLLLGILLLGAYGFLFVIFQSLLPGNPDENWVLSVLFRHYAAALGVPMCAVAALCIVLILETAAGPIDVETPWFKFRGAAAPVIVWMLCFLAMTFAMAILWGKSPLPPVPDSPSPVEDIQTP